MSQASFLPQQYSNSNLHMVSTASRIASSSSTRTTKVIEELQKTLDSIQKEVESTKQQLQTTKESKEQLEKENETYIQSNKQLRVDINKVLQTLESKQELLESTKKSSQSMENKVKQLKDEALAARKELDELKQKEKTFQTEICNIKTLKETQRQQQVALQSSIDKSQADFDKEMNMLQDLLDTLIHSIDNMKARDIQKETETLFAIQLSERNDLFTQLKKKQEELKAVDQQFIDDIRDELRDLTDQNNNDNRTLLDEVANSREGANALIERIKTTASSLLINEER